MLRYMPIIMAHYSAVSKSAKSDERATCGGA
jgi:hypothetical protein